MCPHWGLPRATGESTCGNFHAQNFKPKKLNEWRPWPFILHTFELNAFICISICWNVLSQLEPIYGAAKMSTRTFAVQLSNE